MRISSLIALGLTLFIPTITHAEEIQEALGGYVTVYVDNFEGTTFQPGTSKRKVCLPRASEIAGQFRAEGAEVETIFRNQFFSLYKIQTMNKQKLFVHCNQNGSLVIGWKADGDVASFVDSATAIGITLQEKAIDAQAGAAPAINNNVSNQAPAK